MNSIESWGAVIGLIAYFLFKFVGKSLSSPVDSEAPTYTPEAESQFPELEKKEDSLLKKLIFSEELRKRRTMQAPKIESRFGEEIVESQIVHDTSSIEMQPEEEKPSVQLDFSDYDELKRGVIYSEILQRRY